MKFNDYMGRKPKTTLDPKQKILVAKNSWNENKREGKRMP